MIYLSNAFSLQMLNEGNPIIRKLSEKEIPELLLTLDDDVNEFFLRPKSIVGHQDTANVLSDVLKVNVAYNREQVVLNIGDVLFVAQYTGGRLPEGATELPVGSTFIFYQISIVKWNPTEEHEKVSTFYFAYIDEGDCPGSLVKTAKEIFGEIEYE